MSQRLPLLRVVVHLVLEQPVAAHDPLGRHWRHTSQALLLWDALDERHEDSAFYIGDIFLAEAKRTLVFGLVLGHVLAVRHLLIRPIPGIERLFGPALEVLGKGAFDVVPGLDNSYRGVAQMPTSTQRCQHQHNTHQSL